MKDSRRQDTMGSSSRRWVLVCLGVMMLLGLAFNLLPGGESGVLRSAEVTVLGEFKDKSSTEETEKLELQESEKEEEVAKTPSSFKWHDPIGEGVDLDKLHKCVKKQIQAHFFNEATSKDDGIPLMSKHWMNNRGELWGGGGFGTGTLWAISKSKHLAYLVMPKAGSMSLRAELGYCNEEEGIPCDVLNEVGRPWQPEDARMNFRRGFYRTNQLKHAKVYSYETESREDYIDALTNAVAFTFVSDPISKFIGAFIQVRIFKVGKSTPETYSDNFMKSALAYTRLNRNKTQSVNPHYAPQMYYLVNAALERSMMASNATDASDIKEIVPPFDFVGRMDRATAQKDWETLRRILLERYPDVEGMVKKELITSNGSRLYTPEEKAEIKKKAIEGHFDTWMRQVFWTERHYLGKQALGDLAHVSTWPKDLAQRFCAAFYTEYICFGLDFPDQCKDENGNLDVGEHPLHIE